MDRSDQVCIASDEGVIINGAAMLVLPVKINSHCTTSEIDILAQIRIAAVDEMRQLRAIAHIGILDFDEITDLHMVMQYRIRTEMDERPDLVIAANATFMTVHAVQMREITAVYIGQLGIRSDLAVLADDCLPLKHSPRQQHGITADFDILLDIGMFRIDDADPGSHKLFCFAKAQDAVSGCELDAGIHPHRLIGIVRCDRNDLEAFFDHDPENIRQIVLALCIFVVDLFECIEQGAHLEDIRACIDLMDGELFRRAILLFYNACHVSRFITEHTAIAERIIKDRGQHRSSRALLPAGLCQMRDRLRAQQRRIPADDQHIAVSVFFKFRHRLHDSVTGPKLLLLMDKGHLLFSKIFSYQMFLEAGDHDLMIRARFSHEADDLLNHRYSAYAVQHLWKFRLHACALSGS